MILAAHIRSFYNALNSKRTRMPKRRIIFLDRSPRSLEQIYKTKILLYQS